MQIHNKIRVNIISRDQILVEKMSFHFKTREDICVAFSREPLTEADTEIYIAPVEYAGKIETGFSPGNPGIPVIYYGNPSFLRKAFLTGGVDYLKDPWTIDELDIRLEKAAGVLTRLFTFPWGTISFNNTEIITEKGRCTLQYQEYRIIKLLLQHRGKAVPRDTLFYSLWKKPASRHSRVIDVHISSLRKKIRTVLPADYPGDFIISLRGVGYMIK
jgi:hypothetical protein